jgi:hypothetical protein
MPLSFGEPAPWFTAPTASSPEFVFDSAAGRYVVMLFLPGEPEAAGRALKVLAAHQQLFDDDRALAFVVAPEPALLGGMRDLRGLRWIPDAERAVHRAFQADAPHWLLLDPALRAMDQAAIDAPEPLLARLAGFGAPGDHAGAPLHAPVLVAPRIFEPELCERLIALHSGDGGAFTGVMRDAGDRTVYVMDALKKRRDVTVRDPDLVAEIRERLERRLFPFIARAFGFHATRIERYLVSCYDEQDGGVFRPHRDNTTHGTAHRAFACSLNLNDGFEGGDLRFAEFGAATYRPPVGGAVVFGCGLMHEALPVTQGRRYAFLPFLYDEAGARVLAAYQARTGETPA